MSMLIIVAMLAGSVLRVTVEDYVKELNMFGPTVK